MKRLIACAILAVAIIWALPGERPVQVQAESHDDLLTTGYPDGGSYEFAGATGPTFFHVDRVNQRLQWGSWPGEFFEDPLPLGRYYYVGPDGITAIMYLAPTGPDSGNYSVRLYERGVQVISWVGPYWR